MQRPGRPYYKAYHITRLVPRSTSHQLHDISEPPLIRSKCSLFSSLFGVPPVRPRMCCRHKSQLRSRLGGPQNSTYNVVRRVHCTRGSVAHNLDPNLMSHVTCCCEQRHPHCYLCQTLSHRKCTIVEACWRPIGCRLPGS